MDQANGPQVRDTVRPELTTRRIVLLVGWGLVSAALWAFAIWEVYVQVPRTRKLLRDFNVRVDPLASAVLEHGGLVFSILIAVGFLLVWWTRSAWALRFTLLGLPLNVGVIIYFVRYQYLSDLVNSLAR